MNAQNDPVIVRWVACQN